MCAKIRASGFKLTPQRAAIVREIVADPTHPTAQELFERLRPAMPTMSFATVYNTLDALASAGLCAALSLAPGATRFDPNMGAHHHAVCDRCGLIRDLPIASPSAVDSVGLRAANHAAPGFVVRSVERIYRGVCAACVSEANAAERRGEAMSGVANRHRRPRASTARRFQTRSRQ